MFITPVNSDESNTVRYKYDVSAVPASFLGNDVLLGEINALIVKLETGFRLQSDIDHAYSDFAPSSGERCIVCFHVVKYL